MTRRHLGHVLPAALALLTFPPLPARAQAPDTASDLRTGHTGPVTAVALSADGRLAVTASEDGTAILWDPLAGRILRVLRYEGNDRFCAAALSADGKLLALGGSDATATVWDTASGKKLRTLKDNRCVVTWVEFGQDAALLLTANAAGGARAWRVASGAEVQHFKEFGCSVSAVALSKDGHFVGLGRRDEPIVELWDLATGKCLWAIEMKARWVSAVCISNDAKLLIAGLDSGYTVALNMANGELQRAFGGEATVLVVALSPDGKRLVTGLANGTAVLWDVATGKRRHTLRGHSDEILCVAFSPDGRQIMTGSKDGTARLWEFNTGKQRQVFQASPPGPSP